MVNLDKKRFAELMYQLAEHNKQDLPSADLLRRHFDRLSAFEIWQIEESTNTMLDARALRRMPTVDDIKNNINWHTDRSWAQGL